MCKQMKCPICNSPYEMTLGERVEYLPYSKAKKAEVAIKISGCCPACELQIRTKATLEIRKMKRVSF